MPEGRSGSGMDFALGTLTTARRYWWVVLAVVVLTVAGAIAATMRTPTTYTARASLIVSSNDRSPDQDAVLVQGYVTFFNDPAYQSQLLSDAKVPSGVSVGAHAAAASPILLVDATTSDAKVARSAAAAVAQAFRKAINKNRDAENAAQVTDLREKINVIRVSGDTSDTALNMISDMQNRILDIQGDRVNMLQVLELNAGVTQNSSRLSSNVAFALLGGLLLGTLAALAAARLFERRRPGGDAPTGGEFEVLVEIPPTGAAGSATQERFRALAALVKAQMSDSAVVAVTAPGRGPGPATVAAGLAMEWARQGFPTLLVRADGHLETSAPRSGRIVGHADGFASLFGESLGTSLGPWLKEGPVSGMWVLEPALSPADGDLQLPADSLYQLLAHTDSIQAIVVLEAPAVVGSADAQVLCAASERTILVIDPSQTRAPETAEAAAILEHLDSGFLGAVVLHPADGHNSTLSGRKQSTTNGAGPMTARGDDHAPRPGVLVKQFARGRLARAWAQRTDRVETGER